MRTEELGPGWKGRKESYEKILNQMENPSSHLLQKLSVDLISYLSDVNPNCQKVALLICQSYLTKPILENHVQLVQTLILKCLTGNKKTNLDLAISLVETCLDQSREYVMPILLDNLNTKSTKIIISILQILTHDLQNNTYYDNNLLAQINKNVIPLMQHRDPNIRRETQIVLSSLKTAFQNSPKSRIHSPSSRSGSPLSLPNSLSLHQTHQSSYPMSPSNSIRIKPKKRQSSVGGLSAHWFLWLSETTCNHLQSSAWQDVVKGINEMKTQFKEEPTSPSYIIYGIASIFNVRRFPPKVMQEIFETLSYFTELASKQEDMPQDAVTSIINFLIDKQFDSHFEKEIFSILDSISHCQTSYLVTSLYPSLSAKNPTLPARILSYFSHNPIQNSMLITKAHELLSHPDPHVRASADAYLNSASDLPIPHSSLQTDSFISDNEHFQSSSPPHHRKTRKTSNRSQMDIFPKPKSLKGKSVSYDIDHTQPLSKFQEPIQEDKNEIILKSKSSYNTPRKDNQLQINDNLMRTYTPKPKHIVNILSSSTNDRTNSNKTFEEEKYKIPKLQNINSIYFLKAPTIFDQSVREKKGDSHTPLRLLIGEKEAEDELSTFVSINATKYFNFSSEISNGDINRTFYFDPQKDDAANAISEIGEFFLNIMENDFKSFMLVLDIVMMWWAQISLALRNESDIDLFFAFLQTIASKMSNNNRLFDQFEIAAIIPMLFTCAGRNFSQSHETLEAIILLSPPLALLTEISYLLSKINSEATLYAIFKTLCDLFSGKIKREDMSSNDCLKLLRKDEEATPIAQSLQKETLGILSLINKDSQLFTIATKFEAIISSQLAPLELCPEIAEEINSIHFMIYKWVADISTPTTPDDSLIKTLKSLSNELNKEPKLINSSIFIPHFEPLFISLIYSMHLKFALFEQTDMKSQRICKNIAISLAYLLNLVGTLEHKEKYLTEQCLQQLIMEIITYLSTPKIAEILSNVLNRLLVSLMTDFTESTFISLLKAFLQHEKFSPKWGKFSIKSLETCAKYLLDEQNKNEFLQTIQMLETILQNFFTEDLVKKWKMTNIGRIFFKFLADFITNIGSDKISNKFILSIVEISSNDSILTQIDESISEIQQEES